MVLKGFTKFIGLPESKNGKIRNFKIFDILLNNKPRNVMVKDGVLTTRYLFIQITMDGGHPDKLLYFGNEATSLQKLFMYEVCTIIGYVVIVWGVPLRYGLK